MSEQAVVNYLVARGYLSAEQVAALQARGPLLPQLRGVLGDARVEELRAVYQAGSSPEAEGLAAYEVERELARGGMGVVSIARHRRFGRRVALKRMLGGSGEGSAQARARFVREGQALGRLQHPNVVRVFEVGETVEGPWLAMELVEGESLEGRLERGVLEEREAVELVVELARGLEHAHGRGILHRDLKPDNVLISREGVPKLTDFGLAKLEEGERLTQTGESMGTPGYMAPEQAAGEAMDARTDVYGLGAVLYAVLAGRAPFEGETAMQLVAAVLSREPDGLEGVREGVSGDLATVVHKALAMERARRYRTVGALREDLERWLRGEPIVARRPGRRERLRLWARRHPRRVWVGGLCGVGVLGLWAVWTFGVRAAGVGASRLVWEGIDERVEAGVSWLGVEGVVEGEGVEGLEVEVEGGLRYEVERVGSRFTVWVEGVGVYESAWVRVVGVGVGGGRTEPLEREVYRDTTRPGFVVQEVRVVEEGLGLRLRFGEPGCVVYRDEQELAAEGFVWEGVVPWDWLESGVAALRVRDAEGNTGRSELPVCVLRAGRTSREVVLQGAWTGGDPSERWVVVVGEEGEVLDVELRLQEVEGVVVTSVGGVQLGVSEHSGVTVSLSRGVRVEGVSFVQRAEGTEEEAVGVRVVGSSVEVRGCAFDLREEQLGSVGVKVLGNSEVEVVDCAFGLKISSGVQLQVTEVTEQSGGDYTNAGRLRVRGCRFEGEVDLAALAVSLTDHWLDRPVAVRALGGSLECEDVVVEDMGGLGIYAVSADVVLRGCRLVRGHSRAVFVQSRDRLGLEGGRLEMVDCEVLDNLREAVFLGSLKEGRLVRCRVAGTGMFEPRSVNVSDPAVEVEGLHGVLLLEDCAIENNATAGLGVRHWLSEGEAEVVRGWSEEEVGRVEDADLRETLERVRAGKGWSGWSVGARVELRGCRLVSNCFKDGAPRVRLGEVWVDVEGDEEGLFPRATTPRVVLDGACVVQPREGRAAFAPPLAAGFVQREGS